MRTLGLISLLAIAAACAESQQLPKNDRKGTAVSAIRNDSTSAVTIEYHTGGMWQPVKLESQTDTTVAGDRVRVATTRQDQAILTVDLPIEAGKKYRLIWNTQAGMWDFSGVAP